MPSSNSHKSQFTLYHLLYFIALNIIMTVDIGFFAPLIVKIKEAFGVNLIAIGTLFFLFTFLPAILIPIFGILADKGKRISIIFAMVLCGATVSSILSVVIIISGDIILFTIFGLLAAIINVAYFPAVSSLIADYVAPENRAGIMGWMGIAGTVAIGLGFIVSGIIPTLIFGPDYPLWFPFAFDAIAGFIFAGFTLFLKEPPRGIQEEGLQELHEKGLVYEYTFTFNEVKKVLKKSINQLILLFTAFGYLLSYVLGTYFIAFLVENHGFIEGTATMVMMGIFGIQLVGQVYWGSKGDQAYKIQKDGHLKIMKKTLIISTLLLSWVFLIPIGITGVGFYLFILFSLILATGAFFGVGFIPCMSAVYMTVNTPENRGTASSVSFIVQATLKAVMGLLFTILVVGLNNNYALGFFFFVFFNIPAILLLIPMRKRVIPAIDQVQEELRARITEEETLK